MRGRLVVVEGYDASGKTTQVARLGEALDALVTREPGDTRLGAQLRQILLDGDDLDARAEALLFAADRAQHVAEVIAPALDAGRHVVSDRYVDSSVAYQGYGRGLVPDEIRRLSEWASAGLSPDLVILLDVPLAVARERMAGGRDRIEREVATTGERVRAAFVEMAARAPERWVVLDATAPADDVADAARRVVEERLGI